MPILIDPGAPLPSIVAGSEQRVPDAGTACDVTFRTPPKREPEAQSGADQSEGQGRVHDGDVR